MLSFWKMLILSNLFYLTDINNKCYMNCITGIDLSTLRISSHSVLIIQL